MHRKIIMTKNELIILLAAQLTSNSTKKISKAVQTMLEQISHTIATGGRIEIRGFGSFCMRQWGERHARNPTTGETWRTAPTAAVYFKSGNKLRERVKLTGSNQG